MNTTVREKLGSRRAGVATKRRRAASTQGSPRRPKELEQAAKKSGQGMAEAMAKMGVAVGSAVGEAAKTVGTAIEPVDFRELKALLPNVLAVVRTGETTPYAANTAPSSV